MKRRLRKWAEACSVGACMVLMTGCVVEEPAGASRRGVPVRVHEDEPIDFGLRPVASPVLDSSVSTRVVVGRLPLGAVEYDGQVLPLVAPDGRFIAVEQGRPPSWNTLTASPGATPALQTTITTYNLAVSPIEPFEFAERPPAGVILGRGADESGFLIEWPRPDGSRWIGHVDWITGRINWLADTGHVNAHGMFTVTGDLLYTRREIDGSQRTLVLRRPDGAEDERTAEGVSILHPLVTADPHLVYALASTSAGLEVLGISVIENPPGSRKRVLGPIEVRNTLAPNADAALAYQIASSALGTLNARATPGDPLVLYHPRQRRLCLLDNATGGIHLLPRESIAAARALYSETPGYVVTTPEGLVFWNSIRDNFPTPLVISDPFVARATTDPDRGLLLFGPARRPGVLHVVALSLGS